MTTFLATQITPVDVNISIDEKTWWFVATIPELNIITQWETFDQLIKNINEAVWCTIEADKKILGKNYGKLKFNFLFDVVNASYV